MNGFKVVDTKLTSARHYVSGGGVQYKLNEWVRPTIPNSALMCFESLPEALSFQFSYELIYECEVELYKGIAPFLANWPEDIGCYSIATLYMYINNLKDIPHETPPSGTLFCSAIKLIGQPIEAENESPSNN